MDEKLLEAINLTKHLPIIVEGPNDRKALENLGFTNICECDGPLFKIVEEMQDEKEIAILTDLDSAGKKLYHYFHHEFSQRGVKINNRLRIALFKTPVRQIEGLVNFLEKIN